jgi:hypothetical protein
LKKSRKKYVAKFKAKVAIEAIKERQEYYYQGSLMGNLLHMGNYNINIDKVRQDGTKECYIGLFLYSILYHVI